MSRTRGKPHRGFRLRAHDPVRRMLLSALALVALLVAGMLVYRAGYQGASGLTARDRADLQDLKGRVAYLTKRNAELTRQAAQLSRSGEINGEAARQVQRSLNEMEARLTRANEQLAFYRSIVSPTSEQAGLHVQRFRLHRLQATNRYDFELVLTQTQRGGELARGRAVTRIRGRQGGKPHTLDMATLAKVNMAFAFKYFQGFKGSFELPTGFVPDSVVIEVRPFTRGLSTSEKTYSWKQALRGG